MCKFLNHHSTQYLDLHSELMKIEYSLQSEAAWTKFKVLLLLEISHLHGCDYDWTAPSASAGKEAAEQEVLGN